MRELKITQQITNRAGKSMEAYLREVNLQPMISPEEEVELAKRIKTGDDIALGKLIKANLRFVISVAKQYQHNGLELEDLINEGNLGLITAAKRFDETRGFKFISYAVWWIRQSIIKAISEKSRRIRLPANRSMDARKIAQAAIQIEQQHERQATEEEISELLDKNSDQIRELSKFTQKEISIDSTLREGDDSRSMMEVLADKNVSEPTKELMDQSLSKEIDNVLSTIDEKDAEILRLSFGLNDSYPMSLQDISTKLSISQERVRQIRNRALKRLRKSSNLNLLKSYL
jgi:RNA polymerase primary sigma factor